MKYTDAPRLFVVAPTESRWDREQRRRGAPFQVQAKRFRGIAVQRRERLEREAEEMGEGGWGKIAGVDVPRLKRIP